MKKTEKDIVDYYAKKYNEEFKESAGGYVGRIWVERLLVNFLKAIKKNTGGI